MSASNSPARASPASSLAVKDVDDWVQPFGCNHVIVSVNSLEQNRTGGEDQETKGYTTESYCIICGASVTVNVDTPTKESDQETKPDEVKTKRNRKTKGKGHFKESTKGVGLSGETSLKEKGAERKRRIFERSPSKTLIQASSSSVSCSMHSHKKVKYFCEDHQEMCCSVCVNVLHSRCNRVMFIRDVLNTSEDKNICAETITALQNLLSSFQSIIDLNEEALEELKKQRESVKRRQTSIKENFLKLLDQMEKDSDRKMDRFMKIAKSEIDANIKSCSNAIEDIKTASSLLTETTTDSSPSTVFITSRKILAEARSYDAALHDVMHHTKDMIMDFVPESDITSIENINTLGNLTFQISELQFPESISGSLSKLPQAEVRSPRSVKDVFSLKAKPSSISPRQVALQGKFSVRLADDKYVCENVGCTFLNDGRIAITDMKNCKLKIFDQKFRHGSSLKLSSAPRDVTATSPVEVAVSLPDEGKIQFVSVSKHPKSLRAIHTSIPCYGITHYNQELVVLCDSGFSTVAVQIISLSGEVKRTVTFGKTGRVILKNPWYLTLNPDGQQIYVTDRGRLVCMDIAGSVIFQYTDENLDNARGVTIDTHGYLYVCGTSSNNVHQVSPEGSKVQVLVSEADISSPQAICYQSERRLLLLTSAASDTVTVYKITT